MKISKAPSLIAALCLGSVACTLGGSSVRAASADVRAVPAAAFVDSIGVNTHFGYTHGPYVRRWPEVRRALLRSGIRHIRDALFDTTWQPFYDHLNDLGERGVGVTLIASADQTPRLLAAYPARVHRIDAYEDPNESDNPAGSPDWAQQVRTFAPILWTAAKKLSPQLPVVGPSLQTCDHYKSLGDLSAYMDYGNSHDYFSGRNPGTSGFGPRSILQKGFGSLAFNHLCARAVAGSHPMSATETGYTTSANPKIGIPPDVEARYMPRLFLEQWRSGMVRSFAYELADEGTGDVERHYGLLDADVRPKPAMVALSALIAELAGPAPAFAANALSLRVESPTEDVHAVLFEKADRSFVLAIWREVPCYDVPSRTYLDVPAVQTMVHLERGMLSSVTVKTFDDRGGLSSSRYASSDALPLAVSDHLSLVSFTVAGD
jgi:hypothetical protein